MWVERVLHARRTNREDFYETVSLFDDDTGQPIKLDGCTTVNGQSYTFPPVGTSINNAWTINTSDANGNLVSTTYPNSITIPAFPIGNQVTAFALTVATGLAIAPGAPVTITDTGASGQNSMVGYVTSYAAGTGALVCQIGVTFQFEIRRGGPRNYNIDDYTPFFFVGQVLSTQPIISATLGLPNNITGSITHIDTGVVSIRIPEAVFKQLERRTYQTAMTMTDSVDTRELFIGELPVGYGGVTN
jgi:hypothetical protein